VQFLFFLSLLLMYCIRGLTHALRLQEGANNAA
jgi:hypothetical protein